MQEKIIKYVQIVLTFVYRASLDNVFFPSVTLCNINQGRRSFFVSKGLSHDSPLMSTVLSQAYFGSKFNLTSTRMAQIQELFSSQEVVTKGLLGNLLPTKIANFFCSSYKLLFWRHGPNQNHLFSFKKVTKLLSSGNNLEKVDIKLSMYLGKIVLFVPSKWFYVFWNR